MSTTVTWSPRAAKIEAYSIPITPAPSTSIERGMRGSRRMLSESNTVSWSNGTSSGRLGEEPVAMTMVSADRRVRTCPSTPLTDTVCGSTNRPCPWKTWIR